MLVRVALVGLGGALGAVARYLLGTWIATRVESLTSPGARFSSTSAALS